MVRHDRILKQVCADVDNAAETVFTHARQCGLNGIEGTANAAGELGVEIVPIDVGRPGTSISVERKIHKSIIDHGGCGCFEMLLGCLEQSAYCDRIRDVSLDGDRALWPNGCRQLFGCLCGFAVINDDARALGGEGFNDAAAQTSGATGY